MRAEDHLGPHFRFSWVVRQPQAKALVDLALPVRRNFRHGPRDVTNLGDERSDLFSRHARAPPDRAKFGLGPDSFRLGLGDPFADLFWITPGFERGSVAGHLGLHLGDLRLGDLGLRVVTVAWLVGVHLIDRLSEAMRRERLAQPAVDASEDGVLSEVDVARMVDLVAQGVLTGKGAAVVGGVIDPLALHLAPADPTDHHALERIGMASAMWSVLARSFSTAGEHVLGVAEGDIVDQLWMNDLLGEDPLIGVVPAQLGRVPERHVLDVQQHFVLTLPVPHLTAGVAGVGKDGSDGALGPGDSRPVTVALRVVGGGARDAVAGQPFGDREQPLPLKELSEDSLNDGGGIGIRVQAV
nr:hypothetical protein [Microtetraspora fusca]